MKGVLCYMHDKAVFQCSVQEEKNSNPRRQHRHSINQNFSDISSIVTCFTVVLMNGVGHGFPSEKNDLTFVFTYFQIIFISQSFPRRFKL